MRRWLFVSSSAALRVRPCGLQDPAMIESQPRTHTHSFFLSGWIANSFFLSGWIARSSGSNSPNFPNGSTIPSNSQLPTATTGDREGVTSSRVLAVQSAGPGRGGGAEARPGKGHRTIVPRDWARDQTHLWWGGGGRCPRRPTTTRRCMRGWLRGPKAACPPRQSRGGSAEMPPRSVGIIATGPWRRGYGQCPGR